MPFLYYILGVITGIAAMLGLYVLESRNSHQLLKQVSDSLMPQRTPLGAILSTRSTDKEVMELFDAMQEEHDQVDDSI